ncbi:ABC transporter permease [Herbiconiux moechotypicola]|uniref:ABC transporter permease n=1 Tax=Herbiconiux moechotypicola TaxID=637393 RepID=A0ABN3E198_9MICO|nr:ABC transporter permease [Herbiconiux moechotypicola]MCS5731312.1 ABC transporter permease [Herbiconiux moechotypicola]
MKTWDRSSAAARFGFRDVLAEALSGAAARPGRLIVGTLGTAVGIGALVLALGLGATASGQVSAHFDAVASTHVEVTPAERAGADGQQHAVSTLPTDSVDRVDGLAGIRSAVLLGAVEPGPAVRAVPIDDPSAPAVTDPPVRVASGELMEAIGAHVVHGRAFDRGHELRGDRVAVLGAEAAERLGVRGAESAPSIFLDGIAYTVVGLLDSVEVEQSLLTAVIIPFSTARHDFGSATSATGLMIAIEPGAGEVVAHQVPIALDSGAPDAFTAAAPAAPAVLQGEVAGDLDLAFLAIGVITLVAGGLGIANVTMLSVAQRRGEIGLRRALGATRRQIAAQFAVETVLVGALGGLIGAGCGVLIVVAIAAAQGWTPVLDPLSTLGATVAGGVIGLVAGAYPALSAARIEPADALRE